MTTYNFIDHQSDTIAEEAASVSGNVLVNDTTGADTTDAND